MHNSRIKDQLVERLEPTDPFGEALHLLRMSGIFYCRSELTAPWGLKLPPFEDCMMFHVITEGEAWIISDDAEPQKFMKGELALVPHGEGHVLLSQPEAPNIDLFDADRQEISHRYEHLRHGGGGARSIVICGLVRFDHPAAEQLIRVLPDLMRVNATNPTETEWIQNTMRFIADEARELRLGGETVVTRLSDILVIQAIRSWLINDPTSHQGWLGALRDKQIGRALMLIHRNATASWTLESLAAEVGMSRSAFAARFTRLVGQPAMHYVAQSKMKTAAKWLQEEQASLGEMADRLGYDSEAAFSRAFKRFIGVPPSTVRRRQQTTSV
jgi:AraC-like DNA-binding protein